MIRIGFLYTRLRIEEKYLLDELEKCPDVEVVRINDGDAFFDINQSPEQVDESDSDNEWNPNSQSADGI